MNLDEFEKSISAQPVRSVPEDWRKDVLSRARRNPAAIAPRQRPRSTWAGWLWPSPIAWAGLAILWMIAFGFNWLASQPVVCQTATISQESAGIRLAHYEWTGMLEEPGGLTMAGPQPGRL